MQRHKLGTYAGGVVGMDDICSLLSIGIDPDSSLTYPVIGNDLNGAPIEAGFPTVRWQWDVMPQSDFEYLMNFIGATGNATVTIRTKKQTGASGFDFGNYRGIMKRPTATYEGLLRKNVVLEFVNLVAI